MDINALASLIFAEVKEFIQPALDDLAARIEAISHGNDGSPGRDGNPGEKGEAGLPGRDGADGRSVTIEDVRRIVEETIARIPVPKNGSDGKDGRDGIDGRSVTLDDP